ncbi:Malectin-like domain [Dillenia turbinata]|uniref:Malectin-like domain n=1 Tax=Dillenia turbinata TaxID=194707 RepID=A0AAN8UP28_9MAGN
MYRGSEAVKISFFLMDLDRVWDLQRQQLAPQLAGLLGLSLFLQLQAVYSLQGNGGCGGFISIDCGIDEGSDYDDKTTGLRYTSDTLYINTGANGNVSPKFSSSRLSQQLSTVRSFPEGVRNCYTLFPINNGDKYLIRASFMYGNYDNKNQTPEFSVHIDANEWGIVTFARASTVIVGELIYAASTHYVDVCLVNTGLGTPFISTLELRPLNGSIYQIQSGSLGLFARADTGSISNQTIRYKDDAYDRVWYPYNSPSCKVINSSFSSDLLSSSEYKLPPSALRTALQPRNESKPLKLSWEIEDATEKFYVYLHFAEVQSLRDGEVRELVVTLNDDSPFGAPFQPKYMTPNTLQSSYSLSGDNLTFTISKTENSTLPPIINALEIYRVLQFQQLPTNQDDVASMKKIRLVYSIDRNWQGNPCVPKNYTWNGLNCTASGYDSPSIISLNLSSSRLTGKIDSSILNLKFLESLDLSNNSLYGSVPDFSQLSSLRVLNLSWNKLTGSLPVALLARVANSSLLLSVEGNPDLCLTLTCKKENKVIIPAIASVGLFLVAAIASLTILWMWSNLNEEDVLVDLKDWIFTYAEVVNITNNFEKAIGKGGFGTVYIGHLMDGTQVAVKMLSPSKKSNSLELGTKTPNSNRHCTRYYINSRLSEKSDVYSFGIVLLELITGQPAILKDLNKTHLVRWVSSMLARAEIRDIIDPRLCGDFDTNSVWKSLETAMACVPSSSIQRPTLSQVLTELKGCLEIEVARERWKTDEDDHDCVLPRSISMEMVQIGPEVTMGPQASLGKVLHRICDPMYKISSIWFISLFCLNGVKETRISG